jgi:hypothetical protein
VDVAQGDPQALTVRPGAPGGKGALRAQHPDWKLCGTSLRATEAERCVVAVFYQESGFLTFPSQYKLFSVPHDLSTVVELPCSPDSPYWIHGRK